ncbi:hypothetical protein ACO2Q7_12125 [Rathayibacter sp. KR2-224]|uniref:hypothetical protein n=1 Tax=Rathayibacter sp. KR2-224 TaxID=3400913 RepID=UPI003BFFDEC0
MSDTNGQPDPDLRTEPLEGEPLPDQHVPAKTSTAEENQAADQVDEEDRPRPSTDAETQEDTVSGGPAD